MNFLSLLKICTAVTLSILLLSYIYKTLRVYPTDTPSTLLPTGVNTSEATSALLELCNDYSQGRISGDLCNRICFFPNFTVLDTSSQSKVEIVIDSLSKQLVLRSSSLYSPNYDTLSDSLTEVEFLKKVVEQINLRVQLEWPLERARFLIDVLYPSFKRTEKLSQADRRSLWSLVVQDEYLSFTMFAGANIFPKIFGTCGHFYAVEFMQPFKLADQYENKLRWRVALHVSGTLKCLYDGFINEPLHWCNVDFSRLAVHPDYPKRFVITDGELVFTHSRMETLFASLRCRDDADCRFDDCVARCDNETRRCGARLNDNIEVFCKKLIYTLYGDYWTANNRVLSVCHHVDKYDSEKRYTEMKSFWIWSLSDVN